MQLPSRLKDRPLKVHERLRLESSRQREADARMGHIQRQHFSQGGMSDQNVSVGRLEFLFTQTFCGLFLNFILLAIVLSLLSADDVCTVP
ncbi:hypothetical protein FOZ63_018109, partial [Perkinsus olseni]